MEKNRYSMKIGSKSGEKISQVHFKLISHNSEVSISQACVGQREVSSSSWITAAHHWLGLLLLSGSNWRKHALQMCSCLPVWFPLYNPSLFKFGCIRGFPNWIHTWHVTLGPAPFLSLRVVLLPLGDIPYIAFAGAGTLVWFIWQPVWPGEARLLFPESLRNNRWLSMWNTSSSIISGLLLSYVKTLPHPERQIAFDWHRLMEEQSHCSLQGHLNFISLNGSFPTQRDKGCWIRPPWGYLHSCCSPFS